MQCKVSVSRCHIVNGALACFASLLLISSSTAAEAIRLSDLIDNDGTVISGDKLFTAFGYAKTGDMPPAEDVNVIMFDDRDGNFGLRFQGGFLDAPGDGASDALITYRVQVTDSQRAISAAQLSGNVVESDSGTATVTETFLPTFTSVDDVLRIPSADSQLVDLLIFDEPQRELFVQKDILMHAQGSHVDASFIDQTFFQVPEPGSFAMLGTALLSVFLCRSNRRIRIR